MIRLTPNYLRILAALLTAIAAVFVSPILSAQSINPTYKRAPTTLESLMPPSPEPASVVKYAEIPFTHSEGVAELEIPIYTLQGRELSIPITLRYRSGGIKLEEIAGVAGLGWTLEAGGCVTRTVADMPDEFLSPLMTHGLPSPSLLQDLEDFEQTNDTYAFLRDVLWHYRDTALDRYDYSVCGLSGSFYILDDGTVFQTAGPGVKISFTPNGDNPRGIASFTIVGPDGISYYLSRTETAHHRGTSESQFIPQYGQADQWDATTAWYVTSVTSASGCETATFSYADPVSWAKDVIVDSHTAIFMQGPGYNPPSTDSNSSYISSRYDTIVLSGISLSGFTASFSYASDTGRHYHKYTSSWASRDNFPKRLTRIDVNYGSTLLQRVEAFTGKDQYDGRILLNSLRCYRGGVLDDKWDFTYDTRSSQVSRYSQDWYGYFNAEDEGATQTRMRMSPYVLDGNGNMTLTYGAPDPSEATYMSLTMANHDGMKYGFAYEGNSITAQGISTNVGLRIKSLTLSEGGGGPMNTAQVRRFSYADAVAIGTIYPSPALYTTVSCSQSLSDVGFPGFVYPVYTWTFTVHESTVNDAPPIGSARVMYGTVTEDLGLPILFIQKGHHTVYHYASGNVRYPATYTLNRFPDYWESRYTPATPSFPISPMTGIRDRYADPGPDSPALLTRKETFVREGDNYTLVESEDYTYEDISRRNVLVDYRVTQVMQRYQAGQLEFNDMYHYPVRAHDAPGSNPTTTVKVGYHSGGNDTTVVNYNYLSRGDLSVPARIQRVDFPAKDRERSVRFTYADTWTVAPAWASSLNQRHQISIPLKTEYGYTEPFNPPSPTITMEIDREYGWFSIGGNQRIMLRKVTEKTRGVPSWSEEILTRDNWGNPASIKEKGRPLTTITWGYGGLYPVRVTDGSGADTLSTAYTWQPGAGITSMTDPSGIETRYTYDGAGRLTAVTDNNDHSFEEYEYHFMADSDKRRSLRHKSFRNPSGSVFGEQVNWWDVYGRHIQDIQIAAAGDGRDLVHGWGVDYAMHDDVLSWLPYPATSTAGAYQSDVSSQSQAFHGNAKPYQAKVYEESARDRVLRTALPGYEGSWENESTDDVFSGLAILEWEDGTGVTQNGTWPESEVVEDIVTDADGRRTSKLTDRIGRTLATTRGGDELQQETPAHTLYVYDTDDRLRAVVSPDISLNDTLDMWRYGYDSLGRLASKGLPGRAQRERYTYDAEDRVIAVQRSDGLTETEYDSLGRIHKTYHTPTGATGHVLMEQHWYDSETQEALSLLAQAGQPAAWSEPMKGLETCRKLAVIGPEGDVDGYSLSAIRYDDRGRPVLTVSAFPDGGLLVKTTTYDFAGSPTQSVELFQKGTLSNTLTTSHTYDNWGRELATVSLLSGNGVNGTVKDSTAISYDALGRPAYAVSYPSTSAGTGPAVSSSLGYALQGWICNKGTVVSGAVGAPAYVERLRYDEAPAGLTAVDPSHTGMITSRADTLAYGGPSPFTRLAGYGYDTISRLTNVADNQSRTAYTYDGRGNILSALHYNSGGVLTSSEQYSYSGDRLTSRTDGQSTVSFTHDVMGRMTADGLSGLSVSYNSLDRPKKIASNGVDLANYSYLADGTLLSAVDGSGEGLVYRGSLIYRKDSSGTLTLESAGFDGGRITPGGVRYHVTDHLGSVVMVIDGATGTPLESGTYGEYGQRSHLAGTQGRYHFSGKEDQGPEFGIPYTDFGARHYSPSLRRWLAPDPLSEKYYGISPYTYCDGDPVNMVDPEGKEPVIRYVGTIEGFIGFMNSLSTGIGSSRGATAHAAMLRMGITRGTKPANTGPFNSSGGNRYIYTRKGGWIDMAHFMFYAGRAYGYKQQKLKAQELVNSYLFPVLSIDSQSHLLRQASIDPQGESIQDGYLQEFTDSFIAPHSAYSYEDLPSDKAGADFGANVFNPDSEKSLSEQIIDYFQNVLKATTPQNAPNYKDLPEVYPNKPTQINTTTTPLYVQENQ